MTQEQLDKLARAINERRGYSVEPSGAFHQLLLNGKRIFAHTGNTATEAFARAPRVCTDREAAMDALEGWADTQTSSRNRYEITRSGKEYFVELWPDKMSEKDLVSCDESLPLAISLALASAMGIDVKAATDKE